MRTFGTAIFSDYKKDIVGHSKTGIKTADNFLGFNVDFFFPQERFLKVETHIRDYSGIASFYLTIPQYFCNIAGCFCLYFKTMSVHSMQPMDISLQTTSMGIHVLPGVLYSMFPTPGNPQSTPTRRHILLSQLILPPWVINTGSWQKYFGDRKILLLWVFLSQ